MSTDKHSDTTIIIRVYNEAKVVRPVVEDVLKQYQNVVCVDDGSTDSSVAELSKTKARIVQHPFNLGAGAALQTGLEFALQDKDVQYFVCYDADGQHSLSDVAKMLDVIRNDKLDMVIGSRFLGTTEGMPALKRMLLKLAIRFSHHTAGVKLTDAHNGLRAFNRYVAETLNITMPDFAYASEIVERMAEQKYTFKEVPVTIKYTEYSRAKGQSMINAINIGFDVLLKKISR